MRPKPFSDNPSSVLCEHAWCAVSMIFVHVFAQLAARLLQTPANSNNATTAVGFYMDGLIKTTANTSMLGLNGSIFFRFATMSMTKNNVKFRQRKRRQRQLPSSSRQLQKPSALPASCPATNETRDTVVAAAAAAAPTKHVRTSRRPLPLPIVGEKVILCLSLCVF